ncbi:MAG: tRNA uridine-5-carboxymethylaminomethyl(34) synthesis GTPase MnmE [Hyphomicrobium sp.]
MSETSVLSTIYALSSAPGRAAVAIVRISGPRAGTILNVMSPSRPKPRFAVVRDLLDPESGAILDKALVLWMPGPRSFTGEDFAELQIHGGRAVVAAVLDAVGRIPDCRLAEPGEFVRRAFYNGKIDLTEAEGLADLLDAETDAQRQQAVRQARGELSAVIESWRSSIIDGLSLVEASIDFSDEKDVAKDTFDKARSSIQTLQSSLCHYLDDANRGEILRDGFRIVLAGPPNVGKSSLLNVLARKEAALVSEEAGTTRDVIEVHLDIDGFPVILSDTAGLRQTEMRVENAGIQKALEIVREADLILCLIDPSTPQKQIPEDLKPYAERILLVFNKSDLIKDKADIALPDDGILLSAKSGEGIKDLTKRLGMIVKHRLTNRTHIPSLTNARQRTLVLEAQRNLKSFLENNSYDTELRAEDLRQAAHALGRLTGRIEVEEILDRVFSRFCIGK